MKRSMHLSVPAPCHEAWEEMQPNGCGRFCHACQKTVIDFTTYSDAALAAYFQQAKAVPCGQFEERQLNVLLLPASSRRSHWLKGKKYIAAVFLGLSSLATRTYGQLVRTEQVPPGKAPSDTTHKSIPTRFVGQVIDERGKGVPQARIADESGEVVIADAAGRFELFLAATTQWPLTLALHADGMVSKTVQITGAEARNKKSFQPWQLSRHRLVKGQVRIMDTSRSAAPGEGFWYRITKPLRKKQ